MAKPADIPGELIEAAYLSGMTLKEVGANFGLRHPETVSRILTRRGVKCRRANEDNSFAVFGNAIAAAYLDGLTLKQVGNKFGISLMTVARYLAAKGIDRRASGTKGMKFDYRPKGEKHHKWAGGRYVRAGYVVVLRREHPNADGHGYFAEHRLIVEQAIGRYLTREEVVHHINGNKSDNRIENLLLLPDTAAHRRLHGELNRAAKKAP